ncbi:MAG: amino acid adenylation domain-containing protein [Candidatus Hydrogenedentes bacterium]|nr:amino acid adenylation domain-containing protein [Candidatus Hydrogenedentota bacterium]
MKAAEVLARLLQSDIHVWFEGDELCFRAPKGALTAELRGHLTEHKAELRALLGDRRKHAPASFAQQRLWFLDQWQPGSPLYTIATIALRLTGPLHIDALEQALNEIVRRHDSLRTTFDVIEGQPVQIIAPPHTIALPIVDISHLGASVGLAEARRIAIEEMRRPFNIKTGPLLRARLLRLNDAEHVLLVPIHHIISDGWSVGVFISDLMRLYEALVNDGETASLPELPMTYADYAQWQRQTLRGDALDRLVTYWKEKLAGCPPVLPLPTDRPHPAAQTYAGAQVTFSVGPALAGALKTLSQQAGVSLFMTLLAAFKTLLHRYTNCDDIPVGSATANRGRPELAGMIGFFVNTLVLRTDLSGNPTFRETISRVREVTLDAYEHQEVPFEKLVEELQPERSASHSPFFQSVFVLHNLPKLREQFSELTMERLDIHTAVAKFDLTLAMEDSPSGIAGHIEYNTDLFDRSTMARMAGHFVCILDHVTANPDVRLWEIPLLTDSERQQVLVEWNATVAALPDAETASQMVQAWAVRTPDAVAVTDSSTSLTYRELNARANRVGRRLRSLGIGPESLVGICLERTTYLPVAVLGVMKAGGAYLPLDPTHPKERLAGMLADAGAQVVVTRQHLLERLPKSGMTAICLDESPDSLAAYPESDLPAVAGAKNLAYVIYTSGSTGTPKGVEIEHGGLVNLIAWHQRAFAVTPSDRAAMVASPAFDASVWELWPYVTAGASVHIPDVETRAAPAKMIEWLAQQRITVCFLPTPLAEAVLDEPWPDGASLRAALTGGDVLHKRPTAQTRFALYNQYGPTENTVVTTSARIEPGTDAAPPEIGRPISNTRVYLLDRAGQPVPVGVPGELHVGGAGVARGYRNHPELTAEKFVSDSFSEAPGGRLYRTGDLARYRPDGNIEFLGRIDQQVKIRGFRIEPAEIEAVLGQHPAMCEVAVIPRDDAQGRKCLVAYIVSNGNPAPATNELRAFLLAKLPDYMVPAAFVSMDAIPRTSAGKVDWRALPHPDEAAPDSGARTVNARDIWELELVHIWEEVFQTRPIGVTDDFFDLGGHSFLAVHVMDRVQKRFGRELPITTLFQAPTIERMASILRSNQDGGPHGPLVAIQPNGSKRPFFCVHPAPGIVFCYADLARRLDPDQPFYGLQALGLSGEQAPLTRTEDMAAVYVEALRTVQPHGPYRLGGHSSGSIVAFEMAQQLRRQGEEVELLVIMDTKAPAATAHTAQFVSEGIAASDDALWLSGFVKLMGQFFGKDLDASYTQLAQLGPDEQLRSVLKMLQSFGFLPPDAGAVVVGHMVRVCRANFQAALSYVPTKYPGRITLLRTQEPFLVIPPGAGRGIVRLVIGAFRRNPGAALASIPTLLFHGLKTIIGLVSAPPGSRRFVWGWDSLSAQPVDAQALPGNHVTTLTEPHVQAMAEALQRRLNALSAQ